MKITVLNSLEDIEATYGYYQQHGEDLDDLNTFLDYNYAAVYDSDMKFVGFEQDFLITPRVKKIGITL